MSNIASLFGTKKPNHCKIVDSGLLLTDIIYAYFDPCLLYSYIIASNLYRLKDGPFYVPDFYHNVVEIETATNNGQPVISRYNNAEFVNYTGRGYIVFGYDQVLLSRVFT